MAAEYVELRCRSAFSFLDGASLPEDLIAAAAGVGMGTLALGDRDGVYGAPRFFAAARKAGHATRSSAPTSRWRTRRRCCCWCESRTRLPEPLPPADRGARRARARPIRRARRRRCSPTHAGGLVALAGARAARRSRRRSARRSGAANVFLELQRHLDAREALERTRGDGAGGRALGVGVVATNDVRYATPRRAPRPRRRSPARAKRRTVDDIGRRLLPQRRALAEVAGARWPRCSAIARPPCARRRAIAERCAFTLADLGYRFPRYPGAGRRDASRATSRRSPGAASATATPPTIRCAQGAPRS